MGEGDKVIGGLDGLRHNKLCIFSILRMYFIKFFIVY